MHKIFSKFILLTVRNCCSSNLNYWLHCATLTALLCSCCLSKGSCFRQCTGYFHVSANETTTALFALCELKRLKFKWQFQIETVVSQTGWQRSAKERDWWREGGKGDEHNFRQVKYPRAQLGHRFVSRCCCYCFCYCYEIITLIYLAGLRWEHFLAFVCTYVCVYM